MRKMEKAAVLAVLAALILSGCAPKNGQPRQISVNGEAVVYVKPDKIDISFGVSTRNVDLQKATAENNAIIKKAKAVLKESGIEDKDIQTGRLSINLSYRYSDDKIDYYNVNNSIAATLYNADIIDKLISDLIGSGINQLYGVEFRTSELQKYRVQAREMAVEAAQKKAAEMAAVLGQEIAEPLAINEGYTSSYYYYQPQTQNAMFSAQDTYSGEVETVALGQIPVRASVSASFRLKD